MKVFYNLGICFSNLSCMSLDLDIKDEEITIKDDNDRVSLLIPIVKN